MEPPVSDTRQTMQSSIALGTPASLFALAVHLQLSINCQDAKGRQENAKRTLWLWRCCSVNLRVLRASVVEAGFQFRSGILVALAREPGILRGRESNDARDGSGIRGFRYGSR